MAASCYGGLASLLTPLTARMFGPRYITENYGVMYVVFGLASLIGPSLATTFKTAGGGSYTGAYMTCLLYTSNVTRVFDMMGGAAKMIEPNSTVVLKPNAGHAAPPEFAVCTHPETVRAVIHEVKKANPKRIVIAEEMCIRDRSMTCSRPAAMAKPPPSGTLRKKTSK